MMRHMNKFTLSLLALILLAATAQADKKRPMVMIGLCNVRDLAEKKRADEWKYVRENLDGIWLNGAGTGAERMGTIIGLVETRNATLIQGIKDHDPVVFNGSAEKWYDWAKKEKIDLKYSGMSIVNDYDPDQREMLAGDMAAAERAHVPKYTPRVFMNVRGRNFDKDSIKNKKSPLHQLINNSDGVVYEIGAYRMASGKIWTSRYYVCHKYVKDKDKLVYWLVPRGVEGTPAEYLSSLKKSYDMLKREDRMPDAIILINYGTKPMLEALPECDKNGEAVVSLTGTAYWLIKQIEKDYGR